MNEKDTRKNLEIETLKNSEEIKSNHDKKVKSKKHIRTQSIGVLNSVIDEKTQKNTATHNSKLNLFKKSLSKTAANTLRDDVDFIEKDNQNISDKRYQAESENKIFEDNSKQDSSKKSEDFKQDKLNESTN